MIRKTISIFGSSTACENSRIMLENLPQVKRIDTENNGRILHLFLSDILSENRLIPLLKESGISGFGFE